MNEIKLKPDPSRSGPGVEFLTHYLRDLSFETPHGPCEPQQLGDIDLQRNVRVEVTSQPEGTWEVNLVLFATGILQGRTVLLCEMTYASRVRLHGIPDLVAPQILGVNVPQALLPEVRRVLKETSVFAGFPAIELADVDFMAVYQEAEAAGKVKRPAPAAG
jgi:preprotein translocase subunit SecB